MAVIRKIKDKVKKIVRRSASGVRPSKAAVRKPVNRKASARTKAAVAAPSAAAPVKDVLGYDEVVVEKAKFSHPQSRVTQRMMPTELPWSYGRDVMVLQVRDPWWLQTFWEVSAQTWNRAKDRLKDAFYHTKRVLRVYDVSQIIFNGHNAHRYFDIEVNHEATSWYIDSGGSGRSWVVDYGLKLPNGEFITLVRSNAVSTPLDGPSSVTDEEWMIPEEMFGRLYGMGFGFGKSSPLGKAWQERFKRALFSGALASPGMASMASPVKLPKQRKFWLMVDCELIVYGATEPDAKVTVQGKPIRLRPDGTFTLRYALPDGRQTIPVHAVASDELEERTITPVVTRQTTSHRLLKEPEKAAHE